jgi:predicted porin
MKKAAAGGLLALVAGSAAAQSGVTLYGLVDIYATRFTGAPGGVNASDKVAKRVDSGGMTTSRWGMRGAEDLGDGLSAAFELSSFIRADTGATGRSDAVAIVAADPFFSREASVSLVSKQYGRIRLGNFSTLMFSQSLGSNAFLSSTVFAPINVLTFIGSPLTGGTGWTNQVGYDSPMLGGFTLHASVSAAEAHGGRNFALRGSYASGPWAVALSWQAVKKDPLTFADGTSPNDTKAWQLAASYDLRVAKVFVHLGQIQNDGTDASPLDIGYDILGLSASVPYGNGSFLVAYGKRKTDDTAALAPPSAFGGNRRREVASVGYDYFLSKRTDVYAVVMRDETTTRTLPAPGRSLNAHATNLAIGIRHQF